MGFMIKLIYKSKNPRTLKNKNKSLLPVHWMHNKKVWITKQMTSDWSHQCFILKFIISLKKDSNSNCFFSWTILMDTYSTCCMMTYRLNSYHQTLHHLSCSWIKVSFVLLKHSTCEIPCNTWCSLWTQLTSRWWSTSVSIQLYYVSEIFRRP